jgi:hypothetical protein
MRETSGSTSIPSDFVLGVRGVDVVGRQDDAESLGLGFGSLSGGGASAMPVVPSGG